MSQMLGLFDILEPEMEKPAPAVEPTIALVEPGQEPEPPHVIFDVAGAHEPQSFFWSQALAKLSHGYLFTGPAGVGKKTFAQRFAQSILCETPKETLLGYCGICTGCTLFLARTHPDYVEAFGTIKIGNDSGRDDGLTARDLVRDLSFHGYRSSYRVVLLGDVAFATHEAANALLKFFEEPPAGVIVILTTDAPGSLLATIRSRFIEVAFGPLATADVERVLVSEGVAPEEAKTAAVAGLGSITRARSVLGDNDGLRNASFAWFANTVTGKPADASFLGLDDKTLTGAVKRSRVIDLIEIVRIGLRDWLALSLPGAPFMAPDQTRRLQQLPAADPLRVVQLMGAVGDVERISKTNVSAGLVVDYLKLTIYAK